MRAAVLAFVVTISFCSGLSASPVVYQKLKLGHIWAHVVYVDMSCPGVRVGAGLSGKGRGSSEVFSSMVSRMRPAAAMTGTFFDTRNLLPIGDIVADGRTLHSGFFRSALCISYDNKVHVTTRNKICIDYEKYDTVICGGITLVSNKKISLCPKAQGFRDPSLFHPNRRTAVGVNSSGKLLLVCVNRKVYLRELALIMMKLGCTDAQAFDGGSSTALYCGGRMVINSVRKLTNILLVYDTAKAYNQAQGEFAPNIVVASAVPSEAKGRESYPWFRAMEKNFRFSDQLHPTDSYHSASCIVAPPFAAAPAIRSVSHY